MSWADEPTLILGADGFVGRNLRIWLEQRGWPSHAIGRADGDLTDAATCERLFQVAPRCGRIVHLATHQRTGQRQYEIPATLLDVNARIHLNVLRAWAQWQPQAKLISTGSSCAYPENPDPITEGRFMTGPLHPSVQCYGLAKQVLVTGSDAYARQYGLRWLHCILATLYGPFDHTANDRAHFIGGMMSRALAERASGSRVFTVWGNPATVRECLYVTDQIEAIVAADSCFENQILNCAANQPTTVGAVARAVLEALDWPAVIEHPENSFQGTLRKVLDSSRFLTASGWKPRIDLVAGLQYVAQSLSEPSP
ncbi:MAG: NAD-dependent epimerase/dehydratase family protein [Acidobacteriaceae bacterium]|nr:NAD-dependent epimerase/dehydratase family protein [Acidobacteriaceae bacterium]